MPGTSSQFQVQGGKLAAAPVAAPAAAAPAASNAPIIIKGQQAIQDYIKGNPQADLSSLTNPSGFDYHGFARNTAQGYQNDDLKGAGPLGGVANDLTSFVRTLIPSLGLDKSSNTLLPSEQQQYTYNPKDFIAHTAARTGSVLAPLFLSPAIGGAVSAGLSDAGNQDVRDNFDVGSTLKSTATGAATGYLAGKAGEVVGNTIGKVVPQGVKDFLNTDVGSLVGKGGAQESSQVSDAALNHDPNNSFVNGNKQGQTALEDFYGRAGKGSLTADSNYGTVSNLAENRANSLANVEDYRLQLSKTDPTMNKITPENIGKIQDAAGKDIQSIIKSTTVPAELQENGVNFAQKVAAKDPALTKDVATILDTNGVSLEKDVPLSMQDYQTIKSATDSIHQKVQQIESTNPQELNNYYVQKDPTTGVSNLAADKANIAARDAMQQINPAITKPQSVFAFIEGNRSPIEDAFLKGSQTNLKAPYLRPGGIGRDLIDKAQDVLKQGTINGISKGAAGTTQSILNRVVPFGATNTLNAGNQQKPLVDLQNTTQPQYLDSTQFNASQSPQYQQAVNYVKSLAASGIDILKNSANIVKELQLNGLPNPFVKPNPTQQVKLDQGVQAYNALEDLKSTISSNKQQFGATGGGVIGDVINKIQDPAQRQKIKDSFAKVNSLVSKATGNTNVNDQINLLQDPSTLLQNINNLQDNIHQALTDRMNANLYGTTILTQ